MKLADSSQYPSCCSPTWSHDCQLGGGCFAGTWMGANAQKLQKKVLCSDFGHQKIRLTWRKLELNGICLNQHSKRSSYYVLDHYVVSNGMHSITSNQVMQYKKMKIILIFFKFQTYIVKHIKQNHIKQKHIKTKSSRLHKKQKPFRGSSYWINLSRVFLSCLCAYRVIYIGTAIKRTCHSHC